MKITILPGGVVRAENESFGDDDGSVYESAGSRHHFKNAAEMTAAMKNPAYKTSKSYRALVKQLIGQSDAVALGLAPDRSQLGEAEYFAGKMQTVREMFADKRYKTDARYRNEVRKMCASQDADTHFPEYSAENIVRKAQTHSIEVEPKVTGRVNPNAKRNEHGELKED